MAPISPWLAGRIGRDHLIGLALIAISVGIVVRSVPGDAPLFTGTVLLGLGVAAATVLIPAAIASDTPALRARLTGTYSMSLSLGPALALGLTIPLMHFSGTDWRGTLALWAGCGLVGVLLWIVYTRNVRDRGTPQRAPSSKPPAIPLSHGVRSVLSDPAVWQLAFYLGITSMTFYTVSRWLPITLMMADIKPAAAGNYTAAINILAMPIAFITPTLTCRGYAKLLAPLAPSGAILGIMLVLTVGASGVVIIVIGCALVSRTTKLLAMRNHPSTLRLFQRSLQRWVLRWPPWGRCLWVRLGGHSVGYQFIDRTRWRRSIPADARSEHRPARRTSAACSTMRYQKPF